MKCKNCGLENPDYLDVCDNCATPLQNKKNNGKQKPSWGFMDAPEPDDPSDFNLDEVDCDMDSFDSDELDELERQFMSGIGDDSASVRNPVKYPDSADRRTSKRNNRGDEPPVRNPEPASSIRRDSQATRRNAFSSGSVGGSSLSGSSRDNSAQDKPGKPADFKENVHNTPSKNANNDDVAASQMDYYDDDDARSVWDRPSRKPAVQPIHDHTQQVHVSDKPEGFDAKPKKIKIDAVIDDDFNDEAVFDNVSSNRKADQRVLNHSSNGKIKIIIGVSIVAILALLALIVFLLMDKTPNDRPSGANSNNNAEIVVNPNDSNYYYVKVFASVGSTVVYENSAGDRKEATIPSKGYVIFNAPLNALLPAEPIDGNTYQATPKVYLKNSDGSLSALEMPSITLNVPSLEISYETPNSFTSDDGMATISGQINQITAAITINGESVTVADDGKFSHTVKFDEAGDFDVVLEAKLSGYAISRKTFAISVTKPLSASQVVVIPDDYISRSASDATSIVVRGTVPVGATVTVSSTDANFSLKTEPTVGADGSFSFEVNLPTPSMVYDMVITATLSNGSIVERPFSVQRPPVYNEFVPTVWAGLFDEMIKPVHINVKGFEIKGIVSEIILDEDYLLAQLTLEDGHTIIIKYHDHYPQASSLVVGGSHTMYGIPMGLNTDGNLEVYIWFVKD